MSNKTLYIIGTSLIAILIIVGGKIAFEENKITVTSRYEKNNPKLLFNPDTIMGKSAYVRNLKNDETLIAINSELQYPLASVVKIMTAVVALDELPEESQIKITARALAEEGTSGLILGENWRRDDLVEFMLVVSSNDGARALANEVEALTGVSFEKSMNKKAQELGLLQTYYYNPTGLDMNHQLAGAYGSAHDQAILLAYAQEKYPNIFAKTTRVSETFATDLGNHVGLNTNSVTDEFPGLLASKTGYTDLAGGNLALVYDLLPEKKITSVILGSTETARFTDSKTLLDGIR